MGVVCMVCTSVSIQQPQEGLNVGGLTRGVKNTIIKKYIHGEDIGIFE